MWLTCSWNSATPTLTEILQLSELEMSATTFLQS